MKTSIITILDIDSNELPEKFITLLRYCECYEDKKEEQHIYNSWDLLKNEDDFSGIFTDKYLDLLREIEGLCVANNCDYFRITY